LVLTLFLTFAIQPGIAQKKFDKLWEEVETYELEGKLKDASEITDKILKRAESSDQPAHLVKAFIYQSKFALLLEEEAQQQVISEIRRHIEKNEFPTNALLQSVYAGFLEQYLNENQYRIRNRTETLAREISDNHETWDINTLVANIGDLFLASLSNEKRLQAIPIENFEILLTKSGTSSKFRPTLYDFLAHRALDFFQIDRPYVSRPKERFLLNSPMLFAMTDTFVSARFPSIDSVFSHHKAISLYQKLEAFHQNSDTVAYVDILLQRLNFMKDYAILPNKDSLYYEVLKALQTDYAQHETSAVIAYELANFLYLASQKKGAEFNSKLQAKREGAYTICVQAIERYPTSDGGLLCEILKNAIDEKKLGIETERNILADKPFLAKVDFQNVDSLFLSLYKIPYTYFKDTYHYLKDSLTHQVLQAHQPIASKLVSLPQQARFYEYSTEIDLPPLSKGHYMLVASSKEKVSDLKEIYTSDELHVTDIALLFSQTDKHLTLKFLSRGQGSPIPNLDVTITDEEKLISSGQTNSLGDYRVKRHKRERNYLRIVGTLEGDTLLHSSYTLYPADNRTDKDEEHQSKMYLFTDRSIYRPGQTVYFKGILAEKKNGKQRVVPNTYVSITVEDANVEDIKIFRLRTNRYGSVEGEFMIPRNTMTGEFYLYMDEDEGDEEGDYDPYWDKVDDIDYAEVEFSVEEYKRPTFEISFEDITENLLLGDSVSVSGKAKAFFGANISQAKLSYQVERNSLPQSRTSYYEGNSQIIAQGETETNKQGEFFIPFLALPDSTRSKVGRTVFSYTVQVEVTDINGETRTGEKSLYLGYHSLKAQIAIAQKLHTTEENRIRVSTKNLNNQPIEAEVDLVIFKTKEPDHTLRKKPWSVVELPFLPKEKYTDLFPNEPYDSTDLKEYWLRGDIVFQKNFHNKGNIDLPLGDISDWESGVYTVEVRAINDRKDTIRSQNSFEVVNPTHLYLPKDKLVDYEVVNSDFKADGFILLQFKTAVKKLHVFIEGYYRSKEVFKEWIVIADGSESVKVPVKNQYKDQLVFNLYGAKFNSLYSKRFAVNFPEGEKTLSIETLSFRNKLIPDSTENWSFRITDSKKKNAQAEVLAAMYDASLDQFRGHGWNPAYQIGYSSYSGAPYLEQLGAFSTQTFNPFNYVGKRNIIPFLKNYHQLDWFGFHFGETRYKNERYLKTLSRKVQQPRRIDGNISGVVADQNGFPLPGVAILINETTIGTYSDFNGFYSIQAPLGSELVFNFIGKKSEQIAVKKSGTTNLVMTDAELRLDEVIISGLGAVRKKSLTGTVAYTHASSVRADIERALQGRMAGVTITQMAGPLQSPSRITIRGMASIAEKTPTLFVIDGVLMEFQEGKPFEATMLPQEVAEIQVLKNSAATALYGSRAANGVVIITTQKGLEEALQVVPRSNLKETAFFFPNLTTDSQGYVNFNFSSPQALTKWKFMLLAHSKKWELGGLEKMLITQKDLSVVPNSPRFLREKDSLIFSAKLSNLTDRPLSGTSVLQLFNGVTGQPNEQQILGSTASISFELAAKANKELSWHLSIPEGIQAIEYKVLAKAGQQSDGEANILPVLPNRMLVTEAQPIWVSPGKNAKIELRKLHSHNSSTLKSHTFTLEYTSNPAWLAIKSLSYLMEFPHECAEQTFSRFYANALAEFIAKNNPQIEEVFESWRANGTSGSPLEKNEALTSVLLSETPWVKDAQNEAESKANFAKLFKPEQVQDQQVQLLSKLNELQLSSGGFPWFSGGEESQFITRHIVAGFGHLERLNVQNESLYKVKPLLEKALGYLDNTFLADHTYRLKKASDTSSLTLSPSIIHYLYTRSFYLDTFPLPDSLRVAFETYGLGKSNTWLTLSPYNKGMLALFLNRKGDKKAAAKILEALIQQAVESEENGMYWKENSSGWYWYQAPIESQALLIEVFTELGAHTKMIDKLTLWLLKNKRSSHWPTTKSTTEAVYALLMNRTDWLSLTDNTAIQVGNEKIQPKKLAPTQKEAGTGYLKIDWSREEITPEMATVQISNKSKVAGMGAVYWQYFEEIESITPPEKSPLHIKKELFIKKRGESGETLVPLHSSTVSLGDLITVRMEITSSDNLEFVHLKDMRASGFEPIDVLSEYKWQDGLGYYQSTRDVATHFFFDRLPQGTYVFEYDVRANNCGDFSNGITTLQSMYAPEFAAHSKGERLRIQQHK
ncbi:MAG: MG2 domain-containing protein, partial [Bacteroidota bacterium]